MRSESFKLAIKNAFKMCFLYVLFGVLMLFSVEFDAQSWKNIIWLDIVFCIVVLISPVVVLIRGRYAEEQGWYSGALFLGIAAEIMVNAIIVMPIWREWRVLICMVVFWGGAFIGCIYYIEKWKSAANRRQASRLEKLLSFILSVIFCCVLFFGKIFRGAAGGRLAQEIMSPDESEIFLWIIILFLEGVFSFAGAMLMTVEGTKRIDRKHR